MKQTAGGLHAEEARREPEPAGPEHGPPPRRSSARAQAGAALLVYMVASVALFGMPVLANMSGVHVGWGADPASHMWFLAWWPHAIGHGINPFLTHAVWAPSGYDLAVSTGIPGPSLILAPLTLLAGPVVSYNVLALAAPTVSAWGAYLLCRRITGRFGPSLVGGYVFGFSTYELGQLTGHPNLALVPMVPLAVLLVLRRVQGDLEARPFVVLLALVLLGQFLTSTEIFFTLTMFGGIAFLLALAFFRSDRRELLRAAGLVALAYAIVAIPLSPYLYYVARDASRDPIYAFYPSLYSTDALNLIVPTPLSLFGRARFADVSARFSGNISEQPGYLGLPLLLSVVVFGVTRWRRAAVRFLMVLLAVVLVASFGPTLRVNGSDVVTFPWRAIVHLALVKYVLPSRLMLYASLVVAVVLAMWLAEPRRRPTFEPTWARWGIALLGAIVLLPNLSHTAWRDPVDTPAFFSQGLYRSILPRGANVLIIPYADRGNSMLWQAETGFYFTMPQGYVSVVPPHEFARLPILKTLYTGEVIPDAEGQLRAFIRAKGVDALIVQVGRTGPWPQLFGSIDPSPEELGGVVIYRVP